MDRYIDKAIALYSHPMFIFEATIKHFIRKRYCVNEGLPYSRVVLGDVKDYPELEGITFSYGQGIHNLSPKKGDRISFYASDFNKEILQFKNCRNFQKLNQPTP